MKDKTQEDLTKQIEDIENAIKSIVNGDHDDEIRKMAEKLIHLENRINYDSLSPSQVETDYDKLMQMLREEKARFHVSVANRPDIDVVEVKREVLKIHDAYLHGEYKDITNIPL